MTNVPASRSQLDALSDAVRAITADLSLERVLRRLAEIAAHLVNARYAALGVPNERGGLDAFFTYGMTEKQIDQMDHYPLGLGLLGLLLTQPYPIRIEDMRKDPRSGGFCAHHPKMISFLGVPIISKGKHLGNLYLCDRLDNLPFSDEDERMISLLAGHAAIAIENARLSDQLRKLAIVEERDRIAMELHDGIIQQIYAIGLRLDMARVACDLEPDMDSQLKAAGQDLNNVIENLRRYIRDLKVGIDYSVALQEQLQEVVDGFEGVSSARLVLDIAQGFTHLTEKRVHALVQILRESLSNIVRHASASEVYVDLHETVSQIELRVSDNGQGFDPRQLTTGRGLKNMQRRVEQLGGTLQLQSKTGRGTTLKIILPHS